MGEVRLSRTWIYGERIGSGGFGEVFATETGDGQAAVVKFVPKAEGAEREILFADLEGVPNVVPIIDSGETDDNWVLVMPRATRSLQEHLDQSGGVLSVNEVVEILSDICEALVALDGKVVHRDLKPGNVLLLDGRWCIADFGISRYAEATTAFDTRKHALSPLYAAPERWRSQRATSATDIYSLGVMAYEMVAGHRPFIGQSIEELRENHLHSSPPPLEGVPARFAALIDESLYKAPEARPTPANFQERLARIPQSETSAGLSKLQEANLAQVRQRTAEERAISKALSEAEKRSELGQAAKLAFERLAEQMKTVITDAAPATAIAKHPRAKWVLELGVGRLALEDATDLSNADWEKGPPPAFDVICVSSLELRFPEHQSGNGGRSHSMWYCDAIDEGHYEWYELVFSINAFYPERAAIDPFSRNPGKEAAEALASGHARIEVAWPFTPLISDSLDEFIDRWASWFADASAGQVGEPRKKPAQGSWRRS